MDWLWVYILMSQIEWNLPIRIELELVRVCLWGSCQQHNPVGIGLHIYSLLKCPIIGKSQQGDHFPLDVNTLESNHYQSIIVNLQSNSTTKKDSIQPTQLQNKKRFSLLSCCFLSLLFNYFLIHFLLFFYSISFLVFRLLLYILSIHKQSEKSRYRKYRQNVDRKVNVKCEKSKVKTEREIGETRERRQSEKGKEKVMKIKRGSRLGVKLSRLSS